MKRCWFGLGLLALLLVLGLLCALFLGRFGAELSRDAAAAAALADTDRPGAEKILESVGQRWQEKRFWLAVLTDHKAIGEADSLLRLLESPLEADSFRENALRLSVIFRQLGQNQLPKWENIL